MLLASRPNTHTVQQNVASANADRNDAILDTRWPAKASRKPLARKARPPMMKQMTAARRSLGMFSFLSFQRYEPVGCRIVVAPRLVHAVLTVSEHQRIAHTQTNLNEVFVTM